VIPIAAMEKQAILKAMRQTDGDRRMAAKLLGIGKTTLYRKLKEYGVGEVKPVPDNTLAAAPGSPVAKVL
jgi:DNA-binding NtrC family response regulator